MGLDLTLIVDQYRNPTDRLIGYTRIGLERHYALFDAIKALQPRVFADTLLCYEDEGLKERHEDRYGETLTELWAGELARVYVPADELTEWNRAALAFVRSLPWKTKIVLMWH